MTGNIYPPLSTNLLALHAPFQIMFKRLAVYMQRIEEPHMYLKIIQKGYSISVKIESESNSEDLIATMIL